MSLRGSETPAALPAASAEQSALAVEGIAKSYGPVQALAPTTLTLVPGEVHALVGENGSGKSTFVGIVSGTVKADAGTVYVGGEACTRCTPAEAQARGALTVFQDGSLFPELTVAQNLYLGTPRRRRPSYGERDRWAARELAGVGLGALDVGARARTLSPADRQLLEIARALIAKPTVLLLDEATSALDAAGVDRALALTQAAAEAGAAVLFVTHRLNEVFRIADRISVLRDGRWEGSHDVHGVTAERLVELMAGTSVDQEFPARAAEPEIGDALLTASELDGERFGPVDLRLRSGEIVGIAGADGNGQQQLLRGIAGVDATSGLLEVGGRRVGDYGDAVGAGLLLLSGDRRHESLFAPLSVRENLAVGVLGSLARGGVVSRQREVGAVRELVRHFGIRIGSSEQPVTALSGGNQQKVALGRALATEPRVLVVDEPTQGVDVRSRMDIYRTLRENANRGLAVVVNSSDASELTGLCDRILVVSRGRIVTELPGDGATEEQIVAAFAGAEQMESAAGVPTHAGPERRRLDRLSGFATTHENAVRVLAMAMLLVVLGAYAQSETASFLSKESLFNVFLLTVPLATVAAAQFIVLYVGGIDISVGATMGITLALMSFVVGADVGFVAALLLAIGLAIVVGGVVGAVNATLIEVVRLSPVIATIATLGVLSGLGLVLRPTPEGLISTDLGEALTSSVWAVPWVLVVVAGVVVGADWLLRSTAHGLRLRSAGLNGTFAYRLGVPTRRLRVVAYVSCAVLAALAGVFLSAQVGIGDPGVGESFTLLAIAAPVLGGASLLGGYGTFLGTLLGAILLVLAQTLTTVLGIDQAYGFVLTGGLTLLALLAHSAGVRRS